MEEKKEKRIVIKPMQVVFAILLAIAIYVVYSLGSQYTRNGRYTKIDDDGVFFDKWTGTVVDNTDTLIAIYYNAREANKRMQALEKRK